MEREIIMKKLLALILAIVMTAVVMCGCSQEQTVKVSKDGKTKISMLVAIPVEMVEELGGEEALGEDAEDMEIKKIDGKDCYVEEETESFSTTTKANKYMIENFGPEAEGYFKKFSVGKTVFSATIDNGLSADLEESGIDIIVKLNISLPFIITKTNGQLSEDKKTVTFDIVKFEGKQIYAYTNQSDKGATIYFKKDYLKTNNSAFLSWNAVEGAEKYTVQYKTDSDKKWTYASTKKTEKTITGLKAGKKYTIRVTAVTKDAKYTSISTYVTTLKTVSASYKATTKTIKLSWKKNTDADGYIIYQKKSKSTDWVAIKRIKDPYTISYTIKGLKQNKNYYYKVVAFSTENGKTVKSSGTTVNAKTKK